MTRQRTRSSTADVLLTPEGSSGSAAPDRGDPSLQCALSISATAEWLLRHASSHLDAEQLLAELGERLTADGVPIWRASYNVHTFHPEVYVRNVVWTTGEGCQSTLISHFDIKLPIFKDSPVAAIYGGSSPIRRKLEGTSKLDFPICEELRAEGGTDYLIIPLCFSDGRRTYVSFSSQRPGGFSDASVQKLINLSPFIAQRLELESAYFATSSLLQLYLGNKAAGRVLAGDFQRGRGQAIDAAIWFCDLRDFTSLTAHHGPRRIVETLDLYFECVVNAVHDGGGEILKFIGDAVLAVFDFADDGPKAACARAYKAVGDVRDTLELRDAGSTPDDIPIRIGTALHVGSVFFGNIGGHGRLDFTVIGSAINEVCRIEPLCKHYGIDLIVSDDFIDLAGDAVPHADRLGGHSLKGVTREVGVYAIARDGD